SVNRASYRAATDTALQVLNVREQLCRLFDAPADCRHAVFTSGVTQSLNMLMLGVLRPGDHCIISAMEHNAVARPATLLQSTGVRLSIAPCDADGRLKLDAFAALLAPDTRMVILQHASNVCGTVQDIAAVGALCRAHHVFFVVDAAQTAGHFSFSMTQAQADAICFTGHKGLLGPQGTGGFVLTPALAAAAHPVLTGGSGSLSQELFMPELLPDKFEPGTPNLPGILGLGCALDFVLATGPDAIHAKEQALTQRMLDALRGTPQLFLPGTPDAAGRTGVVSVDFLRRDNAEIAYRLEQQYGILVRCGLHCAPLAHRTLGTFPQGTVRFSFGWFTSPDDVDFAAAAVRALA
ncbi:MAG: aminotransferase class V-fold PLP-dependent enzyme, partial [Ruthenibacterium sp.]